MTQSLDSAFKCAFAGIAQAAGQRNFKIEIGFAVAAVVLGVWLRIDFTQWAVVVLCMGVVLAGECMNTALEAVVDLASPESHELAKRAKDCAAGAVLIESIAALFVAAFVYLPPMIALFYGLFV